MVPLSVCRQRKVSFLGSHSASRTIRTAVKLIQRIGDSHIKDLVYTCTGDNQPLKQEVACKQPLPSRLAGIYGQAINNFVPKGYPQSVSSSYGRYASGHFASSVFSSAGGVLSMQALLHAVGLGAGAIPMAAALNWVIKDGLGQLGGVAFASFINNRFDADPKKWRIFAAMAMELSSLLEFMTPLCPQYFIPLASIANVGKNISFLAASASRAAIHNSFATNENLADVTAKGGSQSIFAGTIGTGLGIGIASMLGHQYESSLVAFIVCSSIGVLSLRESLKGVALQSLSSDKLMYVYASFRKDTLTQDHEKVPILSPNQVAEAESNSFIFRLSTDHLLADIVQSDAFGSKKKSDAEMVIGANANIVFPESYKSVLRHLDLFADRQYVIKLAFDMAASGDYTPKTIYVLYKDGATVKDIVESYAHVFEIRLLASSILPSIPEGSDVELAYNEFYIKAARTVLDTPACSRKTLSWTSAAESPKNGSVIDCFMNRIEGAGYTTGTTKGLVSTSSSIGWHVNSLLLEPRYARVSW